MTKRSMVVGAGAGRRALALAGRGARRASIDLRLGGNAGGMSGWGTTATRRTFFGRRAGPGLRRRGGPQAAGVRLLRRRPADRRRRRAERDADPGAVRRRRSTSRGTHEARERPERHIVHTGRRAASRSAPNAPAMLPVDERPARRQGLLVALRLRLRILSEPVHGRRRRADFGYHYFLGGERRRQQQRQDHSAGYQMHGLGDLHLPPRVIRSQRAQRRGSQQASRSRRAHRPRATSSRRGRTARRRRARISVGRDDADGRQRLGVVLPDLAQRRIVVRLRHVDPQQRELVHLGRPRGSREDLEVELLARQAPVGREVDEHGAAGRARSAIAAVSSCSQASRTSPLGVST